METTFYYAMPNMFVRRTIIGRAIIVFSRNKASTHLKSTGIFDVIIRVPTSVM